MRIPLLTVVLSFGAAAASAQGGQRGTAATTAAEADAPVFAEPHAMTKTIDVASHWLGGEEVEPNDGFYPVFSGMVTGGGWISVGPGYRKHLFGGHALVDGSASISWRAYKLAQARFELPTLVHERVRVGTQVRWQDLTQLNYFGQGSGSLDSLRSEYRLRETDILGYGAIEAKSWLSVTGRFGWLKKPKLSSPVGPFDRDFPDALQVFTNDPGVNQPVSFLTGNVAVMADTRDHPDHPTTGAVYRASFDTYSDRDLGQFSFRRYEAEGVQLVPVVGKKWLLALHAWGVFSDTSAGNTVPFYMLPSLGGGNTLRAYHDYRFHDRNLLLASAESRVALFDRVDAALFVDAGNVAQRVGDLNLDKVSYGVGLRVHSRTSTIGRMEVAHGSEGWRLFVKLSDPFGLARRSERAVVVPFVP